METHEQIKVFKEFIQDTCTGQLMEQIKKDEPFLEIDFAKLMLVNYELCDWLLESPEDTIKAAELAIESFDTLGNVKNFKARFIHLPVSQQRHPWEIRAADIDKFIALKGVINKATAITPFCVSSKFECPNCGNIINLLQTEKKFKEPAKCGCGRRGKFRSVHNEMVDSAILGIRDDLYETGNDKPVAREKLALLKGDLNRKEIDKLIKPGRKVIVNGYLKYVRKDESVEFDMIMEVNSIEFIKAGWDVVNVPSADAIKIETLASQPDIIDRLANSISDLQGHKEAKIATLFGLAGAPHIYDINNKLQMRGTVHILFIGNPGSGKTWHMTRAGAISPIYEFASASTASGKGLVCAVIKDRDLGYVLSAGVVVRANGGVVVIDEVDKTHEEDYGDHNNAMNEMKIKVDKANISALLDAETSYFCTANPENKMFTGFEERHKEIAMPKDFQDRFDIILPIIPPTEEAAQKKIMDIMLERHNTDISTKRAWEPEFNHDFLRKYIAHCRMKNPRPILEPRLHEYIEKKVRGLFGAKKYEGEQTTRISNRILETIVRLSYCAARLTLKPKVDELCIDMAFALLSKSYVDLGIINEHGIIDWGKMEGISESVIQTKKQIMDIFKELEAKVGKVISIDDLIEECGKHGIEKETVEEYIEKRKRVGDWMEPRFGLLTRL